MAGVSHIRGGNGSSEVVPAPGTPLAGVPVTRGGAEELPVGNRSLVQGILTPGVPQSHQNVQSSYYRAQKGLKSLFMGRRDVTLCSTSKRNWR